MGIAGCPCGTVSSSKCQVFSEELAPLTSNLKLHTSNFIRAKRTQFALGRRRQTEKTVQNEAKLGMAGVCRQGQSCRAWLGRAVKRAKRTQFVGRGPAIADWRLRTERRRLRAGAGGQMCKTNPISTRSFKLEVSSVKREGPGVQPSDVTLHTSHFKLAYAQNEPNCARCRGRMAAWGEEARRDANPYETT
jgi:hypothetical protein